MSATGSGDGDAKLAEALKAAAPHVRQDAWLKPLAAAFEKFALNNNKRVAAAIGQFLVEAGESFQEVVEGLTYTHADRVVAVFPREFPTVQSAEPFLRNPRALANRAYANRNGNGDEASGDGFRFCGRGLIQLTGRTEYSQFATALAITPEQASAYCETPEGAAMSGCWYLSTRGCLAMADQWHLSDITRAVNGRAMLDNAKRIAFANAMLAQLDA